MAGGVHDAPHFHPWMRVSRGAERTPRVPDEGGRGNLERLHGHHDDAPPDRVEDRSRARVLVAERDEAGDLPQAQRVADCALDKGRGVGAEHWLRCAESDSTHRSSYGQLRTAAMLLLTLHGRATTYVVAGHELAPAPPGH